jgi:hypothetical protein
VTRTDLIRKGQKLGISPAPRRFGWRRPAAQGARRPVGPDPPDGRLPDRPWEPGKIQHEEIELLRQRVFGIACGYADCNDAPRLAHDALHKLLLERDPVVRQDSIRWASG